MQHSNLAPTVHAECSITKNKTSAVPLEANALSCECLLTLETLIFVGDRDLNVPFKLIRAYLFI